VDVLGFAGERPRIEEHIRGARRWPF